MVVQISRMMLSLCLPYIHAHTAMLITGSIHEHIIMHEYIAYKHHARGTDHGM